MPGDERFEKRERQKSNKNETGKVITREGNKIKQKITNEEKTTVHFTLKWGRKII